MNQYEVKHNKILPVVAIIASVFILGTSLVIGFSLNTVTGILFLIIGIAMLSRPAAVITKEQIEIKNLLGMTLKRYPYMSKDISFKNNNLYVNDKKAISSFNASINQEEITNFIKNNNH